MKKIILFFVAFTILMNSVTVLGAPQTIDLNAMTLEELEALGKAVDAEKKKITELSDNIVKKLEQDFMKTVEARFPKGTKFSYPFLGLSTVHRRNYYCVCGTVGCKLPDKTKINIWDATIIYWYEETTKKYHHAAFYSRDEVYAYDEYVLAQVERNLEPVARENLKKHGISIVPTVTPTPMPTIQSPEVAPTQAASNPQPTPTIVTTETPSPTPTPSAVPTSSPIPTEEPVVASVPAASPEEITNDPVDLTSQISFSFTVEQTEKQLEAPEITVAQEPTSTPMPSKKPTATPKPTTAPTSTPTKKPSTTPTPPPAKKSQYEYAYVNATKNTEYSIYLLFDVDKRIVRYFTTNDSSVMVGKLKGTLEKGFTLHWTDGWDEQFKLRSSGDDNIALLIDDDGFQTAFIKTNVEEVEAILSHGSYYDMEL